MSVGKYKSRQGYTDLFIVIEVADNGTKYNEVRIDDGA